MSLASAGEYVRVCYYTNWSQYRPGLMKYFPENVDPSLCTHVIYAFAEIRKGHTLKLREWNDDKMIAKFNNIKKVCVKCICDDAKCVLTGQVEFCFR